jgi:protein O-mannosyl-transferase
MKIARARKRKKRTQRSEASSRRPAQAAAQQPAMPFRAPVDRSDLRRGLWVVLGLAIIAALVYAPVTSYEFVSWDDPQYIVSNWHVNRGLTWQGVWWAFTARDFGNWHPLTWLSHMLDVQLFGLNAGIHHLTNLLLHAVNGVLLFAVLCWTTGAVRRSAFVATLFVVHPLHVESVAWVAERKDLLSTLFWMLTLLAYVAYVAQRSVWRYAAVIALFACGLMSKPMVVTLPVVLLLLDVWPLGRLQLAPIRAEQLRPLILEKLPLFALAFASSIVTAMAQAGAGAVAAVDTLPLRYRVENAAVSYLAYVRDMLWPAGLAPFYPYRAYAGWIVASAVTAQAGIFLVMIRATKRHPYVAVGWLWYVVTLLPVIGLVQAGGQTRADRYTYIPLIGLFIIAAWGIPDVLERWRHRTVALRVAAFVAIASCVVVARLQVRYWHDSLALWGRALAVTTENYRAHNHYAVALSDLGKADEAIAHYEEALRIWPGFAEAHVNLGVAFAEKGRTDDAIAHYRKAIALKPNSADAHNDLAGALADKGDVDGAIRELLEALRINPTDPTIQYNVAILYEARGDPAEAVRHLNEALAVNPTYADARQALDRLRSKR